MVALIWKLDRVVYVFVLMLIIVSCTKQQNTLPPKTQEGRNTIGYRVESSYYDDTLFGGVFGNRGDSFYWGADSLFISDDASLNGANFAKWRSHKTLDMTLKYDEVNSTVKLEDVQLWEGIHENPRVDLYVLDSDYFHFFEVTRYDQAKEIISGQFEFRFNRVNYDTYADTILSVDSSDWFRVFDGRLDLKSN